VNRVGEGGDLTFLGGSAIIDPLGQVLAHAEDKETLLLADIDPGMVAEVRSSMPFLKDRKSHLLKKLADES
jgi:(R)-amidase